VALVPVDSKVVRRVTPHGASRKHAINDFVTSDSPRVSGNCYKLHLSRFNCHFLSSTQAAVYHVRSEIQDF
jgi:hypothetical protein